MKFLKLILLLLIQLESGGVPSLGAADLLVAMKGSGRVDHYETATGRHVGSFIRRLDLPNR